MSDALDWLKAEMAAIEAQKVVAQAQAATFDDSDAPRRIQPWGAIIAGRRLSLDGGYEDTHVVPTGYGWGAPCRTACGRKTSEMKFGFITAYLADEKSGEPYGVTCAECKAAQKLP